MKIVLSTPLYPPDIAEPAPYAKELARRLSKAGHKVAVVAYGRLPERVEGVDTIAIDKRAMLPLRLIRYFFALWRAARNADFIYMENGPSVELPAAVVARLTATPLFMHYGDPLARQSTAQSGWRRAIARFAESGAKKIIKDSPLPRPELLPLEPRPTEALAQWEESWRVHFTLFAPTHTHAAQ